MEVSYVSSSHFWTATPTQAENALITMTVSQYNQSVGNPAITTSNKEHSKHDDGFDKEEE